MYIRTLNQLVNPITIDERAIYQFLYDDGFFLNESTSISGVEEEKKTDSVLEWIKKNCWHKPRAWFANILTKLNKMAEKVRFECSQKRGTSEYGLFTKIKQKIATFIQWLTNKMESFIRPDKIGDEDNKNEKSHYSSFLSMDPDHNKTIVKGPSVKIIYKDKNGNEISKEEAFKRAADDLYQRTLNHAKFVNDSKNKTTIQQAKDHGIDLNNFDDFDAYVTGKKGKDIKSITW